MKEPVFKQRLGNDDEAPERRAFTRKSDIATAIASKLVTSLNGRRLKEGEEPTPPSTNALGRVVQRSANAGRDARNTLQILPDVELAKQILIGSVLSPNDMISTELTFSSTAEQFGELRVGLVQIIQDHFTTDYNIRKKLPMMLERILFLDGSYPVAVLPESTIDELINSKCRVTQEAMRSDLTSSGNWRGLGLLGNATRKGSVRGSGISFEAYSNEPTIDYDSSVGSGQIYLTVHDNISAFKFPKLQDRMAADRISTLYGRANVSFEAFKNTPQAKADSNDLYPQRVYAHSAIVTAMTPAGLEQSTSGHPLVLDLASESVIPVFSPSNPEEKIGFFIAVDRSGNPLSTRYDDDQYQNLANGNTARAMSSQLISSARNANEGVKQRDEMSIDDMTRLYTEIVERDLMARLKNGLYGENVKIGKPTEIYRIMLARALEKMYTQLIYVPTALMTYMALDINSDGVGVSLLEQTKVISGLRAAMLFANTMAALRNSVNHTTLNIEFDPDDPDPYLTAESIIHDYARLRQNNFPIAQSNPQDIVNYLGNAGVGVAMSGHPRMPTTKTTVENHGTDRVKVDTDLEDSLKQRHLMSFGVAPESVDLSLGVDFAVMAVRSNILLAKRAMIIQEAFTGFLGDHIQKYTTNSGILMDRIIAFIKGNRAKLTVGVIAESVSNEDLALVFVNSIQVALPEADMTQITVQMDAFKVYSEALDTALGAFVSSDLFTGEAMGDLADKGVEYYINILKAHFQRQWLQKNNVLPELFDLITASPDGGAVFDLLKIHESYIASISATLAPFIRKMEGSATKNNKELEAYEEGIGFDGANSSDSSSSDDSSDEGGSEEGEGGDDDFGDFGGDEESGEDSADGEATDDDASEDKAPDEDKEADKDEDKEQKEDDA